jgi:hypothetical protein
VADSDLTAPTAKRSSLQSKARGTTLAHNRVSFADWLIAHPSPGPVGVFFLSTSSQQQPDVDMVLDVLDFLYG